MKAKREVAHGYKQMVVAIDPNLLVDIKARALFKNISLKMWVLQAIEQARLIEDRTK